MSKFLIATKNAGKIKEFKKLLADLPFQVVSLNEFPSVFEPEETGSTFADNAILKAQSYARQTGIPALADDSGLEVEALSGNPGVLSARYAGEKATDAENISKLLAELNKTGDTERRTRFVCIIAVADEKSEIKFLAEGICEGQIAEEPAGANGFGYDPVFIPDGFSETFGELSPDIKRQISHRGRAVEKIIAYLRDFTAV